MKQIQFLFDGGLGNQFFQFFASKYITLRFENINLNYAFSESISNGYRNFELNNLLKEKLNISKEYNQFGEKIYSKIINQTPLLSQKYKTVFKSKIDLLNNLYCEKYNIDKFVDPLEVLDKDLKTLEKSLSKLKIKGFWQNPKLLLKDLNYYKNFLIDTKPFIPDYIKPRSYISIHIRRGDYLLKENFRSYLTKFSPIQFVLLSLQLLPNETDSLPIYLISEDKKWVKNLEFILSNKLGKRFYTVETKNNLEDWAILRHSLINICSNSTFSYTAAILNNENLDRKLRCILPQWIQTNASSFEKGWLTPEGFIEI